MNKWTFGFILENIEFPVRLRMRPLNCFSQAETPQDEQLNVVLIVKLSTAEEKKKVLS